MKYSLNFRYLPSREARPLDHCQDDQITFDNREFAPIPNVGDSVSYMEDGKSVARKVLTRHFSFFDGHYAVNIVVSDIEPIEMSVRLKD